MDRRSVVIVIGILIFVALGFFLLSNMTGNVVTGFVVGGEVVKEESFRISDFGSDLEGEVGDEEDFGESG